MPMYSILPSIVAWAFIYFQQFFTKSTKKDRHLLVEISSAVYNLWCQRLIMIAADNDQSTTIYGRCPRNKTFTVFMIFYSTTNLFPRIMAWSISNISLQNCYSESFTANSYFPLKTRKFSPADVFRHTVYCTFNFVTVRTPATKQDQTK